MSRKNRTVDGKNLSDAIRSLQNLLDDVSVTQTVVEEQDAKPAVPETSDDYEETLEIASDDIIEPATDSRDSGFDIDSHFDMNIPPALHDEEDDEEYQIPTLSETIVEGDIPVLKEIVKLPDGSMIPEPAEMTLEMAIQSDNLPTPISDAAEAATDAIQIILARYKSGPLTPEVREELRSVITEILLNSPELKIPESIV